MGVSLLNAIECVSGMPAGAMAVAGEGAGCSIGITNASKPSLLFSGLRTNVLCLGLPNGTITALVELFDSVISVCLEEDVVVLFRQ